MAGITTDIANLRMEIKSQIDLSRTEGFDEDQKWSKIRVNKLLNILDPVLKNYQIETLDRIKRISEGVTKHQSMI